MRVFITGGTGLIGRGIVRALLDRGDRPVILSRSADKVRLNPRLAGAEVIQGDPAVAGNWDAAVSGCDAVVNLVGHNIFAERWSREVKRTLRDSRVHSTENLVAALGRAGSRPGVLVHASAIGYYGPRGDEVLTEASPPGDDFMARLCQEWEAASAPASDLGLRVAVVRSGIVLARGDGALGVMTPLFKLGPGAPVGSQGGYVGRGRQWMSWIHRDDIVGLFLLALDHPEAHGPINGTAPNPVTNADFSRSLSATLRSPTTPWRVFAPIGPPDWLLKLALGEVADIITTGQRVVPDRAIALGYSFRFPDVRGALRDLFGHPGPAVTGDPKGVPAGAGAG